MAEQILHSFKGNVVYKHHTGEYIALCNVGGTWIPTIWKTIREAINVATLSAR